jgi:fumarate reductase flavoprotein subunit
VPGLHRFDRMTQPVRTIRRAASVEAEVHVAVAIVGGGACGLTAALMLGDAGIDCVVLERDALPSGSTALSSGFIPAPGTRTQREHGVADDSAARFAADIQAKAHGRAAPALVDAYANAIGPALDALQERHGLAWTLLDGFLYPGHSVHRMHALPQKTGAALMAALQAAVGGRGHPRAHAGGGRRAGARRRRPRDRHRLPAPRRPARDTGLRRAAARLQRLRRQLAHGAHAAARDGRGHLRRPRGQRRQRHPLGRGAGGAAARPGRLPGPRLVGDAAGRADVVGRDDGRRRAAQQRRPPLPRRDAGLLGSRGARARAAGRHRVERVRLAAARAGARLSRFLRAEAAGALRRCDSADALADCIGCEPTVLQATLDAMRAATPAPDRPRVRARPRCAVLRRQGDRRAVPHPGRPRHRARHARAAAGRHAVAQPAGRGRRGGRRFRRRGVGLSFRQRAAERRGRAAIAAATAAALVQSKESSA